MMRKIALLLMATMLLLGFGCARPEPREQAIAYPSRQTDNSRRSGPAMLFYEAAEDDADIYNVTVTPPTESRQTPAAQ